MKKQDTPAGKLGLQFANALVAGDFQSAHSMLSSQLKETLAPDQLEKNTGK